MPQFNGYPAPALPLTGSEQVMIAQSNSGTIATYTATVANLSAAAASGFASPSTATPLVDSGAGAVGTSGNWARGDHVHPTDTSRAAAGGASGQSFVASAFTSVGFICGNRSVNSVTATTGTTLAASQLVNGLIVRTGPSGVFSDTTDTAANIIAAIQNASSGVGFTMRVMNGTGSVQTIIAGSGVTISGTATIAAGAWRDFIAALGTGAVTLTNAGGGTN